MYKERTQEGEGHQQTTIRTNQYQSFLCPLLVFLSFRLLSSSPILLQFLTTPSLLIPDANRSVEHGRAAVEHKHKGGQLAIVANCRTASSAH